MVSVGVGVLLMAIVTAGTSAAMVYGREALLRQEHYKAAAYILRSLMEQQQAELQLVEQARSGTGSLTGRDFGTQYLDTDRDRGSGNRIEKVAVSLWREPIDPVDDLMNGTNPVQRPDYYHIKLHARWTERDYAEDGTRVRPFEREITMETAVLVRTLF
jgi:hypothetical protein